MMRIAGFFLLCSLFSFDASAQSAMHVYGNIRMHAGSQMGVFGDLTNSGNMTSNLGDLHFSGTSLQTVNGTNLIQGFNVHINNANNVKLDNELMVSNSLSFVSGKVVSDRIDASTEFVHFLDGATYSGASNTRHVDGVVRKTGNDPFVFPVGDSSDLQPLEITAPATISDHFTCYYIQDSPNAHGYSSASVAPGIDHISDCEFWVLDRTAGTSTVSVRLTWDVNSCGVTVPSELLVARWDGSTWQNHGNGGTTGTLVSGTVITLSGVSTFSPFTLASISANNPLPIELLSFNVTQQDDNAFVVWETASESNNLLFQLEKSPDFVNWDIINTQNGAGNSNTILTYKHRDLNLFDGIQYYRLKQIDVDGQFIYSDVESLFYGAVEETSVYPNPVTQGVIHVRNASLSSFRLFNAVGQDITSDVVATEKDNTLDINVKNLTSGFYYLQTSDAVHTVSLVR